MFLNFRSLTLGFQIIVAAVTIPEINKINI
jgi:hypothetical protein